MKRGDGLSLPWNRLFLVSTFLLIGGVTTVWCQTEPRVIVGGWGGVGYFDDDRQGTLRTFDAHPWYLYVSAKPAEGWSFFGEFEGEHVFRFEGGEEVEGSGEFFIERLFVERNFSTAHNVRGGKFIMPLGYFYRLHWRFLTPSYSRPISFDNKYAPQFQVGLKYWGKNNVGPTDMEYHLWLGDGPDQFGTDERTVEEFGYGGSLFFSRNFGGAYDLTLGATLGFHAQEVPRDTVATSSQNNSVIGLELKTTFLEVLAEYFNHDFDSLSDNPTTLYMNILGWVHPNFGLLYRYDLGDDLKNAKRASNPESTNHSFGFIYRPNARVQIKGEYRIRTFKEREINDFNDWLVWWGIKF